jgi:hypothetical protein
VVTLLATGLPLVTASTGSTTPGTPDTVQYRIALQTVYQTSRETVNSGPASFIEPDNRDDEASGNGNGSNGSNGNSGDSGDSGNARLLNSLVSIVSCGLLMPKSVSRATCE